MIENGSTDIYKSTKITKISVFGLILSFGVLFLDVGNVDKNSISYAAFHATLSHEILPTQCFCRNCVWNQFYNSSKFSSGTSSFISNSVSYSNKHFHTPTGMSFWFLHVT